MFRWLQDMRSGKMQFFRWVKVMCRKKALYLLRHPMKLFWRMIVFIVVLFTAIVILTKLYYWGEAGYTALGSLFTALAFAGMISTVLLQRIELQEQRKELRAQRRELEGQKEELKIQNRTAQLQRFENSFFHLLEGFKQTVEAMDGKSVSQIFDDKYSELEYENKSECNIIKETIQTMPIAVHKFASKYYSTIEFIIEQDIFKYISCSSYISMLNIELTNYEYKILFYYAIVNNKIDIVNKYGLFRQYVLSSFSPPLYLEHAGYFKASAFGKDSNKYLNDFYDYLTF